MSFGYKHPLARIIGCERSGDVVTTVLEQTRPPRHPVAPGSIHKQDYDFPLHKLIDQVPEREFDTLTFESYETTMELPVVGMEYELSSWGLSIDSILDPQANWERARFEGDRFDDEMCLFSWENMAEFPDGYRCKYGWATTESYNLYVRDDFLRMRSTSGQIDNSHWYSEEPDSLLDTPDEDRLIFDVKYHVCGKGVEPRRLVVEGGNEQDIKEMLFVGKRTIRSALELSVSNGLKRVRIETKTGYEVITARSVRLVK